jgi:hypothetical protein
VSNRRRFRWTRTRIGETDRCRKGVQPNLRLIARASRHSGQRRHATTDFAKRYEFRWRLSSPRLRWFVLVSGIRRVSRTESDLNTYRRAKITLCPVTELPLLKANTGTVRSQTRLTASLATRNRLRRAKTTPKCGLIHHLGISSGQLVAGVVRTGSIWEMSDWLIKSAESCSGSESTSNKPDLSSRAICCKTRELRKLIVNKIAQCLP